MRRLFLSLAVTLGFAGLSQAQTVGEITKKALEQMGKATSISYDFYATERFSGGKIVNSEVKIKYQASPLKIYADAKKPTSARLLYIPSENSKVQVKKGIGLKLDPYNKMLMADQHHPIYKAGFNTFKSIIEFNLKAKGLTTSSADLGKFVKLVGSTTYDNQACWVLEIIDNDYKIVSYTVKAGEDSVWDLGKKLCVPEYRIKELNDIGNSVTPGQVLKVPSSYAKKTTVYIDKDSYLPIYQKMEDNVGVYEIYEFKNLKLNVKFTAEDFTL